LGGGMRYAMSDLRYFNIFATQFLCYRYNVTIYALGAWGAGLGKYRFQSNKYLSLHKHLCYHHCQQAHTMAEAILG